MVKISKAKGNAFEREVAQTLSQWAGEEFHRLPASGALRWNDATWTWGDLLPPTSIPIVVECKHRQSVLVDALLGNRQHGPGEGAISDWWYEQCVLDSVRASVALERPVHPVLVWKENYGQARICIAEDVLSGLRTKLSFLLSRFSRYPQFAILDLRYFLENVSVDEFRSCL